jgi:putative addiction module component (TIGR02574 family)
MLAKSEIQKEALDLPAQERIELVVELWDSLAPGEISVPDWQRDLIRDRLAALEDLLPEERSVPWEAVRKRIFSDKT